MARSLLDEERNREVWRRATRTAVGKVARERAVASQVTFVVARTLSKRAAEPTSRGPPKELVLFQTWGAPAVTLRAYLQVTALAPLPTPLGAPDDTLGTAPLPRPVIHRSSSSGSGRVLRLRRSAGGPAKPAGAGGPEVLDGSGFGPWRQIAGGRRPAEGPMKVVGEAGVSAAAGASAQAVRRTGAPPHRPPTPLRSGR
jgi:hypothetical protein